MPSFADSLVLFVLALLLFGPKKLPVLARELGKWMGEFRRASNEFKMQMEEELRISEQADRQKQIAAMEAAAPVPPPLEEPEHPHLPRAAASEYSEEYADDEYSDEHSGALPVPAAEAAAEATAETQPLGDTESTPLATQTSTPQNLHPEQEPGPAPQTGTAETPMRLAAGSTAAAPVEAPQEAPREGLDGTRPIPIATSGDLHMMPPATGLPTPRGRHANPLGGGLLDAIPESSAASEPAFSQTAVQPAPENGVHGD